LAEQYHTLERLLTAKKEELEELSGIGSKMALSIEEFFHGSIQQKIIDKLRIASLNFTYKSTARDDSLSGMTFVLTGTLPTLTR
jgi:DNA ligase (NAD+)